MMRWRKAQRRLRIRGVSELGSYLGGAWGDNENKGNAFANDSSFLL